MVVLTGVESTFTKQEEVAKKPEVPVQPELPKKKGFFNFFR